MNKTSLLSFFIVVSISITAKTVYAQDPAFSQTYANPLYLNPAFAGTGASERIGLNYRNQWPAIPGNFDTYNASYDRNIIDSNNSIGLLLTNNEAGNTTYTTNVSLIYAHQFHIKSFTLSAGVQATYLQKSIDESKLNFGYTGSIGGFTYQPETVLLRTTVSLADFSAGILGYDKNYFVGFSIDHLSQPDESFVQGTSPLPLKYTANAGLMIPIGSLILSPTLLYEKQDDFNQDVVEGYLRIKHFTVGIGTRFVAAYDYSQDIYSNLSWNAMIFTIGYQNKLLRIGYSYDYSTSRLQLATGGTHEASLAFLIPYSSAKYKKTNSINCPAF